MSEVETVRVKMPTESLIQDWRAAARMIDHTLLRPEATRDQIIEHCRQATPYGFATVCVHPCWVALAVAELRGTGTKVDATVGFPQGAVLTTVKRYEAEQLIRLGAGELDMVINVGMLKSGDREYVENDIRAVAEVAHAGGAILKVILETSLLTREEKTLACELALTASADFVKTSTGLVGGATVEDVQLLRSTVGNRAGVKASGGIRTKAELAAMVNAGANRIGTSAGVKIVKELGAP
jgi:deoxyribose-phosphate aldolase